MKCALLFLALCGCAPGWNAPVRQTRLTGWHRCPGVTWGCGEWEVCRPAGCAYWGDTNDPGAASMDKANSDPSDIPER